MTLNNFFDVERCGNDILTVLRMVSPNMAWYMAEKGDKVVFVSVFFVFHQVHIIYLENSFSESVKFLLKNLASLRPKLDFGSQNWK